MKENEEKNLEQEISYYKKVNTRNNIIIFLLVLILLFVVGLMIYVRFFN